MTQIPAPPAPQTAKTVTASSAREAGELSMNELDAVSGGINPQPLPPSAMRAS
jgi:hypothetical protein